MLMLGSTVGLIAFNIYAQVRARRENAKLRAELERFWRAALGVEATARRGTGEEQRP